MGLLSLLRDLCPFLFRVESKTSRIILDDTTFEECKSKVIEVWRWKSLKRVKVLIHYKGGKFVIKELK